jgi:fermentation-respiration switch protein FrsA (DUF1100 family)
MKKRLLIICGLALVGFATAVFVAGSLLVQPSNQVIGPLPSGVNGEVVAFKSGSGTTLRGWFLPGQPYGGAVVLMHGVRATRVSMLARARMLNRQGYAVLLFDFQGCGESQGEHVTFGYLESRDAGAAVAYMRERLPSERVGVIGVSMGGAAAALADPPLPIDALVLESVYPTIDDAVADRLAVRFGRAGRWATPLLTWQLRPRLGFTAKALRPIDKVGSLTIPKLIVSGSDDRYTTLAEARGLYEVAANPKEFWAVSGAGHEDLYVHAGAEYEKRVGGFLERWLRQDTQPN